MGGLADFHQRLRDVSRSAAEGTAPCASVILTWRASADSFERLSAEERVATAAAVEEEARRRAERVRVAEQRLAELKAREEEDQRKKTVETLARRKVWARCCFPMVFELAAGDWIW